MHDTLICSGLNEGTWIRITQEVLEELNCTVIDGPCCIGGDTVKCSWYLM